MCPYRGGRALRSGGLWQGQKRTGVSCDYERDRGLGFPGQWRSLPLGSFQRRLCRAGGGQPGWIPHDDVHPAPGRLPSARCDPRALSPGCAWLWTARPTSGDARGGERPLKHLPVAPLAFLVLKCQPWFAESLWQWVSFPCTPTRGNSSSVTPRPHSSFLIGFKFHSFATLFKKAFKVT